MELLKDRVSALIAEGFRGTKYDYGLRLGCEQRTAQKHLDKLRAAGLVSVVGWVMKYQAPIPVYAKATGRPDKPRPEPMSAAERQRKYRRDWPYELRIAVVKQKRAEKQNGRLYRQNRTTVAATAGMDEWRTALWQIT